MRSVRGFVGAALALVAGAALAKPLYITVPRSYGTTEAPMVEVAFSQHGPVELRVLRPQDLNAFIQSQADLRRVYEEPPTQYNPGRALSRGLNALSSPGGFIHEAIGPELRKALYKDVSHQLPRAPGRAVAKLEEGAPKMIGVPPGFSVVRSEWLNLDLGGDNRGFDVPGFEHSDNSGFQERQVTLAPLPPGAYVVQIVQERVEGQVMLVVTDLTVQVKQTDGMALVRVAGLDQKPRAGAKVTAHLAAGRGAVTGTTDEKGEALLKVDDPKLLITASFEGDTAIADTDFYSTLAVAPDVFLYTDRPIYHPGDEVRFRGIVRKPDSFVARLFTPRKREVAVKLVAQEDGKQVSTRATVDEFGCFSGAFNAPPDLGTGVLRVVAELDAQPYQSEARVQDYVKPTFYVELLSDQETVTPGEPLKAKIRARRYAGGVPADTAYEVFLYRSALDSPAWVDDAGKGGTGSAVTYGSASTTEGKLSVPVRLYSTLQNRDAGEDPWSTAAKFDANGEAEIEIPVPALQPGEERLPFRYTLSVRARDPEGTFANAASTFFLAQTDVMGVVRASAKVARANGAATLAVKATTLSGKAYGETDGEVTYVLLKPNGDESEVGKEKLHTGSDGVWRGPVPTQRVGKLLARVTLKDKKGRPWSGETSLLVVGEGNEPVARVPALTTEALEGVLAPGTTAQVVALFPEGWGPGGRSRGPVWLTLSGSSLFSTRMVEVDGTTFLYAFDVEKRFGSAVYASVAYPTPSGRWEERTVPFRIIPKERTLSISVAPLRKEAPPLGDQTLDLTVTDSDGHGVAAELSVGVVDKAVYAVQAEFRPSVLDFFYPVGRNNVSNFYSAEFQGYGYGEQIARALLKLPGHAFASIKPPTRQAKDQDRDTAYWNPSVVTDADGHATVRFKLPSNQTLWTVTAVAADASGRFGEGTGEFATRGALNLVASLPQFLREGDEAVGSVRLSRGEKEKSEKTLAVTLAAAGALSGEQAKADARLAAGGEQRVPMSLKAGPPGVGELSFTVAGLAEPMADRRRLAVRPAAVSEPVQVSAYGGGELTVPVTGTQKVESMELVLQPSIVDAALANVRELLTYPYGCLEQLTSTTVPNIALYQTLQKVNALDKLDPESQSLLAEAQSRAVRGIQQILGDEVKGGGFVLWSGESTPSVPLTLIALDGLAYAVDAKLLDPNEPRLTESLAWLEKQDGLPFEMEATRTYVLSRFQKEKAAPRVRALLSSAKPGDLYPLALAVLAADRAGVMREDGLRDRVAQLVTQSRDGFVQLASYTPPQNNDFYWRYPLRKVGMTAVLGHAASFGDLDVAKARRRLLEALTEPGLSTFDRSTALLHSLWLVERDAKALRALPPPAVDGTSKLAFVPRGAGVVATVPVSTRSLKVGSFDGVATLRARVLTPLAEVKPIDEGMSVSRAYYVLREGGKQPLKSGDSVAQGEEIFVELTLDARGSRAGRSAYYVVEDPVPAGFVPVIEDKAEQGQFNLPTRPEALKRRSLSPEKADFFFEEPAWWSNSPRVVGYVLRAQFEGRFSAPPATIEDMYAASIRGRSEAATLTVRASANAK